MLFDDPALSALKKQFEKDKVQKEGTVKATDRGFGFLEVDRDSYFIAPDDMRKVVHGDRISAFIENDDQGRQRAVPCKLSESFLKRFVARAVVSSGRLMCIPDHPNIRVHINCDDRREDKKLPVKSGDFVVCMLTKHALKDGEFRADIIERICQKNDPRAPWTVSLRRYDLPLKEPEDQDFPFLEGSYAREDLTAMPFVTIDSAHTQDMDDALYCERNEDGFKLTVAIADPTGYIAEGSELDAYAARRAFSVYLPGQDIPMLPRILSQNLCSLREGQERPVIAGTFLVSKDGAIDFSKTSFCLGTIKSQGKLVYDEVSDWFEGKEGAVFNPSEQVAAVLKTLAEFTDARDRYRSTHAAPFRNKPDYDFILKEDGSLDHIEIEYRRIANRIVEESMITANVCAGSLLAEKLNCGVFNTHAGFDTDRLEDIVKLLEQEHCPYDPATLNTLEGYNAIRRFAVAQSSPYMDCRIRRLQAYSEISIAPGPHYALGVQNYATWTSPIRKYGDMVNHRLLKSLIVAAAHPKMPDSQTLATMNLARRTNRMAERDVRDWLYVDYLEPDIEKKTVFKGEVFDISRGGMRVTLDDNGAMVFVPFSFMSPDRDSMTLDADLGMALVKGECVLKLGDPLEVRIIEVDHETRSVTAAPAASIGGVLLPEPVPRSKAKPHRGPQDHRSGGKNDHRRREGQGHDERRRFGSPRG